MGYSLRAFIGRSGALENITKSFSGACVIELKQGLSMVPMTEELFDQINNMELSDGINVFEYLTLNIERKILKCMDNNCFAYIEAEYFGGQGGQVGVIWNGGKRTAEFGLEQRAINEILIYFGVITNDGFDEFDTVGLGRHRNTREWID